MNDSFRRGLALLAAALAGAAGAAPSPGGTATLVLQNEPPTLVALAHSHSATLAVSAKVSEGLLKYDHELNPQPQLATAWQVSPDGKTYTFSLRRGVRWHDGREFTSADVAHSIKLLKENHPRGRSTFAPVLRVRTPDAHTAVLELSQPAPYLLKAFVAAEAPIVPKHLYESGEVLANANGNAPIGTGPFRFKEWVRGSHIVYERNPDYWDKPKPYLERLVVRIIPDPAARAIAFETGEVDIGYRTPVSPGDIPRLQAHPKLAFETKGNSYSYNVTRLEFNLRQPQLKELKVRQAIAHAINREVVRDTVFYGYGQISFSPIAPGLREFHDERPTPYPFDIRAAERLLDEAGLKRGADGQRFNLALDYNPSDMHKRLADYVKLALGRVGIKVEIRAGDFSQYVKRIYTDQDYDLAINGTSNLFDPTVGSQRLYWSKNIKKGVPFSNGTFYANPVVDKLLEDAAVELDRGKRAALFKEFQRIVGVEVPDLNLLSPTYYTIHNRRLHAHSQTAEGVEANFAEVYIQ
ncbi:ABC transporter substrate-binding protein [Roseateles sp. DAIF2]|uniref:ABC transporter substrate-binding protein n=1 Tax=Roseateles sp. DAIF2 TaxID=2714952 RepID=UPI0018A2D4A6|nr:ABC transporter substrate-binding protein [Roseateles sp. DAIF2]QPF74111.1 ABC transporter substrate-binding protein [Roseateles sp. DAIF2]